MINRINYLLITFVFAALVISANGQVDSILGQVTSSSGNSFAGSMSANGRLIVFESNGNLASVNPRNADRNNEIFIFDYAQRRIFQITNTRSVLRNLNDGEFTFNIRVDITNSRPVMSADGRWIAFGSNATTSVAGSPPDGTNPGSFDGNDFTVDDGNPNTEDPNPLTMDGNMEMWLYAVPALAPADLTTGDEIPVTDLSAGTFTQITNTPAAIPPVPGSDTQQPIISTDNRIPSISDNGNLVAFISNRDLVANGNAPPQDNPEIFVYARTTGGGGSLVSQITQTPRGPIGSPITNSVPTIAGNGTRVMFSSNGHNPIVGMTGGDNTDGNREVFFTDLTADGAPTGVKKQITVTTAATPGAAVNTVGFGRRMSRNGNLIVFDSYADLTNEHSGTNQAGFATFLYDVTAATYRRIGARSDADAGAPGGDLERFPTFSDYVAGVPQSLVLETRMNIAPNGTIPTNPDDGLNNNPARQAQLYTFPIGVPPADARFKRITKLPQPPFQLGTIQPIPSDSTKRIAMNLPGSEVGTGNPDLTTEVFYILQKDVIRETAASFSYSTGATKIPVQNSPVPTPSPAASHASNSKTSAKSDGRPSLIGTPTPTPTPTPPPSTPAALQGLSPGMLAFLDFTTGINTPVVARTAVGSIDRRFRLPIELSGVTMTISGAAVELKRVSQRQILFVVPPGLAPDRNNTLPIVINHNGTVMRGKITIVEYRPDIFRSEENPEANRARLENITNRVRTTEPFNVLTFKYRGSRKVPTLLRLYVTGIQFAQGSSMAVKFGGDQTTGTINNALEVEPGVFAVDFTLSANLQGKGDQPVLIDILGSTGLFFSRLEADAPRTRIL